MSMSERAIVARSLAARRFSTVITVLTVAVAVALMLVLLSMRHAGRRAFDRGAGNMHLLVSADSSPLVSVLNSVFYARAPARPVAWTQYLRLRQDPRLAYVIPTQQGDSYRGFPVCATTPEFFEKFSPDPEFDPANPRALPAWPIHQGRIFDKPFEVVVGYRAWREVGLSLGDRINLTHGRSDQAGAHVHTEHGFTVVGLLGPTGSPHDRGLFISIESAWIIHAEEARDREERAAGREGDHDHGHGAEPAIRPEDLTPDEKLTTALYIRAVTREGRMVSSIVPTVAAELRRDPRLTVAEPSGEVRNLFVIVGSVDQILVAMAAVVAVSSGVAIMLALYNSMDQRRRQIAVLRVLGCSARGIGRMVLMEAAAIGLAGAGFGLVVSFVGARVVAAVMKQRLGLVVDPALDLALVAAVVGGAVVLAAAAGLVPAAMAYRTNVANNLRPLG
jgi:putative ABC transport system permease protein